MGVMYGCSSIYVSRVPLPFLYLPFYSSKGSPRLHGVGDRVGVDRGVVRGPTRGFRTGVASSRLVAQYFGDDYACF